MRLTIGVVMILFVVGMMCEEECLVVTTEDGSISGLKEKSTKGRDYYSFRSIPYAKPPIGDLRFRPGETEARLPVMVYIFGGAFFFGNIRPYSPSLLLNHDIVFVIMSYRLGMLGFLSTEDSVMPGNLGLKDQTMALQWVQRNIHNFGGDPTTVTLFGHSSGSVNVHAHILSPYSKGLFARAILQSGSMFRVAKIKNMNREIAHYTGRHFGCPNNHSLTSEESSQLLLQCLQKVDARDLTLCHRDHIKGFIPRSRVDGDFLPDQPERLMLEGRYNKVDIMAGVVPHEGGFTIHG